MRTGDGIGHEPMVGLEAAKHLRKLGVEMLRIAHFRIRTFEAHLRETFAQPCNRLSPITFTDGPPIPGGHLPENRVTAPPARIQLSQTRPDAAIADHQIRLVTPDRKQRGVIAVTAVVGEFQHRGTIELHDTAQVAAPI